MRVKFSAEVKVILKESKHSNHRENFLVITFNKLVYNTAC